MNTGDAELQGSIRDYILILLHKVLNIVAKGDDRFAIGLMIEKNLFCGRGGLSSRGRKRIFPKPRLFPGRFLPDHRILRVFRGLLPN
jgi:hypothetical protein